LFVLRKYEYRLGRMLASRFQKIHRAKRIHLEIEQGNLSALYRAKAAPRSGRSIEALRSKDSSIGRVVANVQRRVPESLVTDFNRSDSRACRRRAEENPPHVVIYAHNFHCPAVEMFDRFRPDQSALR